MLTFVPSLGVGLNTSVVSSPIQLQQAQTLTVSGGTFVVNGQDVGVSHPCTTNDLVSVKVVSSGFWSTAVFANVTSSLDNDVTVFFAVTSTVDTVEPTQFDLVSATVVPRNYGFLSNAVTVNISPGYVVEASVPNLYGAYIVKNGSNVGQKTQVSDNDVLVLGFLTPSTALTNISIPMSIGTTWAAFVSKTARVDSTPSAFTLTPVTNATVGVTVVSNTVTILGVDADSTVAVTVTHGTLYKNGVSLNSMVGSYTLNDTLAVSVVASSTSCGVVSVDLTAGGLDVTWLVVTAAKVGTYILGAYLGTTLENFPTTSPVNTSADSLAVLPSSLNGSIVRTNLNAVASGSVSSINYLMVVDPLISSVCLVHPTSYSIVARWVADTAVQTGTVNQKIVGVDFYPKSATITSFTTHTVVALSAGTTDNKLAFLGQDLSLIGTLPLTAAPADCLVTTYNKLYVAYPDANTVAVYDIPSDIYSFAHNISISGPNLLYEDANNSGNIVIGSQSTNTLTIMNATEFVLKTLSNIWAQAIAFDSNGMYVADSLNNQVRVLSKTYVEGTPIQLAGPPSSVACDSLGYLYVTDLATNKVMKYSTAGVLQTSATFNHVPLAITYDTASSSVAVLETLSTLDPSTISSGDNVGFPAWPLVDGVALSTRVTSPSFVVSGLSKTGTFYVSPYPGVSLVRNGVDTGQSVYPFSNGDILSVALTSSDLYYNTLSVVVGECASTTTFSVRTVPNLVPDPVFFVTLYGEHPGTVVQSSTVTISGLSTGFSTLLSFEPSGVYSFYQNGVLVGNTVTVQNGDQISVEFTPVGVYSQIFHYPLNATTVYTTGTVSGSQVSQVVTTSGTPLTQGYTVTTVTTYSAATVTQIVTTIGVQTISNFALGSAIPWPLFGRHLYSLGSQVLEREMRASTYRASTKWTSGTKLCQSITGLNLGIPQFRPSLHIGTKLVRTSRSGGVQKTPVLYPTKLSLVTGSSSVYTYTHRGLGVGVSPSGLTHSANTGLLVTPVEVYHAARSCALAKFSRKAHNIGLTKGIVNTGITRVQWNFAHTMPWTRIEYHNWATTRTNYRNFSPSPKSSSMTYVRSYAFGTHFPNSSKYSKNLDFGLTSVTMTYNRIKTQTYAAQVSFVQHEAWTKNFTSFNYTLTAFDFRPFDMAWERWARMDHKSDPPTVPLVGVHLLGIWHLGVNDGALLLNSRYREYSSGDGHVLEKDIKVITRPNITLHMESPKLCVLTQPIKAVRGYTLFSFSPMLMQSELTFCPPYSTCELSGLFSHDGAVADSLVSSDGKRPITVVTYSGCFLWTEEPNLQSKVCATKGAGDPFVTPYAWTLSQGPIKMISGLSKDGLYVQGG